MKMNMTDRLQQRAGLLADVRRFFDQRGFLEVQTPVLSHDTMIDRYIEPIPLELSLGGAVHRVYLQTSPEFCMKRLVCSGASAIYQIGPAFRGGELGDRHNPEFTMLEWYRAGDTYHQGIDLLAEFCAVILQTAPPQRGCYAEQFRKFVQLDPWLASDETLIARLPDGMDRTRPIDRDNLLNALWAAWVEPHLGVEQPQIVIDWPASQAALAQIRNESPPVADRFELYVAGIELANGYHELSDPAEQRQRMVRANAKRQSEGKSELPVDSRLLEAMSDTGLPPSCGVAVGFDRLLMIRVGAKSLRDVLPFPFDSA